ncbi:N-acetyltransferase [Pilimelia anulata]|uniref:N-acetyltransferase n=1 Tax=Pilimelia anulata TaxID=53371 RepID=A0A8J3B8H0_9ACTN|nr:GNAT family protein [Pilimelia anulata]GGK03154.1 N-acetyltransferase [Pilimelia anulata]
MGQSGNERAPALPLATARLLLRPVAAADLDDVWAYQRLPAVARYLRWEPRDRAAARASVADMAGERALAAEGDCLTLAAECGGRLIGTVELVWVSEAHRAGELGWVFHPAYHGRGLATEAARALLDWGFAGRGLHRIVARCAAGNAASARLAERLGMRREAHFVENNHVKGEWRDEYVYAILRREWAGGTG